MRSIGVKFCGNCNPQINNARLLETIKDKFPHYRFAAGVFEDVDCVIVFSGCEVDCATRPSNTNVPLIVVAGHALERVKLSYEELESKLIHRLEGIR